MNNSDWQTSLFLTPAQGDHLDLGVGPIFQFFTAGSPEFGNRPMIGRTNGGTRLLRGYP